MARVRLPRLRFVLLALIVGLTLGIILPSFYTSLGRSSDPADLSSAQAASGSIAASSRPEEKVKDEIKKLQSLGYLGGSRKSSQESGVKAYEKGRTAAGLNLVVSGHAPEAFLMDMSGDVLHTWRCNIYQAWPDFEADAYAYNKNSPAAWNFRRWRRARLLPNGDLFAIFERIALIKIDKASRLLWIAKNGAHHDLDIDKNGNIYLLAGEARINEAHHPERPIWEDYIIVLDPQGEELKRVSVLAALQNSPFAAALKRAKPAGDILHTNTIELLEDLPKNCATPFRRNSLLISIRELDLVCAVDMEQQTVYWAESKFWCQQHQPTLLDNGNILVLDNKRGNNASAVIEYDPQSREVEWSYIGGEDGAFFTGRSGSCQRLPNGNTLITESDAGRAFEVTPDKKIVWEFINPHKTGNENELIGTLFEVVRLEGEAAWLNN